MSWYFGSTHVLLIVALRLVCAAACLFLCLSASSMSSTSTEFRLLDKYSVNEISYRVRVPTIQSASLVFTHNLVGYQ